MDFPDRAARNEELFRSVNERIEKGAEQHGVHGLVPFHCECHRTSCLSTIDLPLSVYERLLGERYQFVVMPGHEDGAIERVLERESGYLIVEKIGEARAQIDRDHPQQQH
jgi:hypothetical protein